MNRAMKRLMVLGLCVGLLIVGCGGGEGEAEESTPDQPAEAAAPDAPVVDTEPVVEEAEPVDRVEAVAEAIAFDDPRPVFQVDSMQAFLEALGPDRTLELAGDMEFRLDTAERGVSDYYQWREVLQGQYQLIIRNCDGLTIRGPLGEMAYIVTEHVYATVLQFDRCSGLTLENLEIGHDPEAGSCIGAVVGLTDCSVVVINGCMLFGSGTEGLRMENVAELKVARSMITECTYRILTANSSRELTFVDCQFTDNEQYAGFNLTDTVDVRLTGCAIERNRLGEYGEGLFRINLTVDEARVMIEGGRIEGNTAPQLVHPAGMVTTTNVSITGNSWQQ